MVPVREFKARFPTNTKIMDAGECEARAAFEAGADFVTVLGA
jgi:3-keto-L-gulonate-6-phosphate decarboxylase